MTAAMLQTSYGNFHQLQDYNGSHGNLQEVFFPVASQRVADGRSKNKSPASQSYDHFYGLADENNYHLQLNLQPMRREFFNNSNNFENAYAGSQQQQQTTKLSSCNKKSFNDVLLKDHSISSPSISPTHSTGDKAPHSIDKFSPRMSEIPHQNLFFHNSRQHRYPTQNYSSHIQSQDKFSFTNHGNIYYSNEPPYYSHFNYCQTDALFFSPTPHRLNSSDKNHSPSGAYVPSCYPASVGLCSGEDQSLGQTQSSFQAGAALKCNGLKPSPPLMSSSSMSEVVAAAVAAAAQQRGNGDVGNSDFDPRDLEAFAEHFKQRRIKLGATQADVGAALGKLKLPGVGSLSQSTICRFESLTLSHNNMVALKPVLQTWLCEAENTAREARMREDYLNSIGDGSSSEFIDKKRKRTSIAGPEKRSLEAYFAIQPRPSGEKIAQIADKLDLRKNVVRVWFCNQRQKQKRMKFSATSLKSSH